MMLYLDRLDLLPQHQKMPCADTRFEHFSPEAQAAILAAGRGTFTEPDRSKYNVILLPSVDLIESTENSHLA
jgi:hypothetical protein